MADIFSDFIWETIIPSAATGVAVFYWHQFKVRQSGSRQRCRDIEDVIIEFERCSTRYWSIPEDNDDVTDLARDMKSLSKRLAAELSHLSRNGFNCRQCEVGLTTLRRAAMDGDFESKRNYHDAHRVERIQNASVSLVGDLRTALKVL